MSECCTRQTDYTLNLANDFNCFPTLLSSLGVKIIDPRELIDVPSKIRSNHPFK